MKIKILTILLFLPTLFCTAQGFQSNRLHVRSGYFIPSKESFRSNYDYKIFPFSIGLGLNIPFKENIDLKFEADFITNELEANDDVQLMQIPFSIGAHYWLEKYTFLDNYMPYIGANAVFYWSCATTEYIWISETGDELGTDQYYDHYFGYGFRIHTGFFSINTRSFFWGVDLTFDVSYLGDINKGGLGNTGGFYPTLLAGFKL